MDRRNVIKAGLAGLAVAGLPEMAGAAELLRKKGPRVVVIGAGFGGATAAKYVRMWGKNIEVVLIERNAQFVSCPMSNLVLGGSRTLADITLDYKTLKSKYGIKLVQGEVTAIDPEKKRVVMNKNFIHYDRLIVAPGVDFLFGEIGGYDQVATQAKVLHAWKAGPQTVALRKQMEAMPDGGVFVLSIPKAPYRCPPGPYERACQVAHYFKTQKPKSKVIVLDANAEIISKKGLFTKAFADVYGGIVEYRPNNRVMEINLAGMSVKTEFDEIKGDVLNIVPPMRAGNIAKTAGLTTVDERWCGVDFQTYESKALPGIHVIGDATSAAPMPKSGHQANSQAKVCAAAVVALLEGGTVEPLPVFANTCYSYITDTEAVHVANVYRFDAEKKAMIVADGGGVSAAPSAEEGAYARYWAQNIWSDILK